MPDQHPLWAHISQYEPFEVEPAETPLFVLDLVEKLPDMELRLLYETESEELGQPKIDLYAAGRDYYTEMCPTMQSAIAGKAWFAEGFHEGKLELLRGGASALFALNNALMLLFAFSTAPLMTLEMHSSVVMSDGYGYMFLAKSGTGKSTHSSLWMKNIEGTELLNDDNPIVRVCEDGVVRVFGSPWSGKTPCYRNLEVPVGAMVRIKRAPHNKAIRLGILEAYANVYSSSSGFKADKEMADGLHRTMEQVVLKVPCFNMECLPDDEAALVCAAAVKKVNDNG